MNYVLLRHELRPVIIRSADKKNYLHALHQADSGDIGSFIDYIAEQLKWSLEISIKAASGASIDEPGDLEKRLTKLKKEWGDDTTVKTVLKKDRKALMSVINESILPLLMTWQNKLEEFDSFFFSRNVSIQFLYSEVGSPILGGENFVTIMELALETKSPSKLDIYLPTEIRMSCTPLGIRQIFKEITLKGGQIQVNFLPNFYEVKIIGTGTIIKKIYNYSLTEEEVNKLAEELGVLLLNDLEQHLDNNK